MRIITAIFCLMFAGMLPAQDVKIKEITNYKSTRYHILDIAVDANDIPWAVGAPVKEEGASATHVKGMLLQGDASFNNWEVVYSDTLFSFAEIACKDGVVVMAGSRNFNGDYTRVYLTKDAGKTMADITPAELRKVPVQPVIQLPDTGRLYVLGQHLYASQNFGQDWFLLTAGAPLPSAHYTDVYFNDADNGWIVGKSYFEQSPVVYKTDDGGKTWLEMPAVGNRMLSASMAMVSKEMGFLMLNEGFYKTNNGGNTWQQTALPQRSNVRKMHFANISRGFLTGSTGTLLFTDSGGEKWETIVPYRTGTATALHFIDYRTAVVYGWGGRTFLLKLPK